MTARRTAIIRSMTAFALLVLTGLWAVSASANPYDLYGVGSRQKAMGDTGAATAKDFSATHYNPARPAFSKDVTFSLEYSAALPRLKINDIDQESIEGAHGFSAGIVIPQSLSFVYEQLRGAFAISLYLPDQRLAKVSLYPPAEPRMFRYDNNSQRFVITPALSLQVWDGVSIGAGVTFLGGVSGDGLAFDILLRGAVERARSRIDLAIKPQIAPVLGVAYDPFEWLGFGYSFRGSTNLSLDLNIPVDVEITSVEVQGIILIALAGNNFWMPQRHALGGRYDPIKELTLTAELVWMRWSQMPNPSPDLDLLIDIGTDDVPVDPYVPQNPFADGDLYGAEQLNFKDVFSPHFGAEYRLRAANWLNLAFRAGYLYEPSPAPEQTGPLSLLDNDRHSLTLGTGFSFEKFTGVLEKPLDVDLFFQYSRLVSREHVKDLYTDPQPYLKSNGNIFAFGLTTALRF